MEALFTKYSAVPAAAVIDKTIAALKEKKYNVYVADTRADALRITTGLLPAGGASLSTGSSTSLHDIGFVDWLKSPAAAAHTNYKGLAVAKWGTAEYVTLTQKGLTADYFFTSASAVAETGELVWASATATRVSLAAKNTIFVLGANKIVPTEADGLRRLYEWCKPVVGAQTRAMFGVPDTFLFETSILGGQNPFGMPCTVHIVLVKEALGF